MCAHLACYARRKYVHVLERMHSLIAVVCAVRSRCLPFVWHVRSMLSPCAFLVTPGHTCLAGAGAMRTPAPPFTLPICALSEIGCKEVKRALLSKLLNHAPFLLELACLAASDNGVSVQTSSSRPVCT